MKGQILLSPRNPPEGEEDTNFRGQKGGGIQRHDRKSEGFKDKEIHFEDEKPRRYEKREVERKRVRGSKKRKTISQISRGKDDHKGCKGVVDTIRYV